MDVKKFHASKNAKRGYENRQKHNKMFKKFTGNISEGQGFADKRKRKIQYDYLKMMKKEQRKQAKLEHLKPHRQFISSSEQHHGSSTDSELKREKVKDSESQKNDTNKSELRERLQLLSNSRSSEGHDTCMDQQAMGNGKRPKQVTDTRKSSKDRSFKKEKEPLHVELGKGKHRFSKAAEEHRLRTEKNLKKKQEYLQKKEAREQAMEEYRRKKKERFKKLCKKTSKGQPVMKNQIEYLLEKIEKQIKDK